MTLVGFMFAVLHRRCEVVFAQPGSRARSPAFRRTTGSGVLVMASSNFSASSFNALATVVRVIGLHPKLGEPSVACARYVALICHVVLSCTISLALLGCVMCTCDHGVPAGFCRLRTSWAPRLLWQVKFEWL